MKKQKKQKKQNDNDNDNHINYVVNEEKRTCTAYLEDVRNGMIIMVNKRLEHVGLHGIRLYSNSFDGKDFLTAVTDGIPDKVVATVRCSPEDEFNPETGCALARVRLLRKMYDYRYMVTVRAMNRLAFTDVFFNNLRYTCDNRAMNYEHEEDAILNSLKKSN